MSSLLRPLAPQPLIGIGVGGAAVAALTWAWLIAGSRPGPLPALLALVLTLALVASYRYAVHVQRATKVCMASVPLYLAAALLPPPLGATIAGAGVLLGTGLLRSQRGLTRADIVTDAGRWVILVLLGGTVAHLAVSSDPAHTLLLVATGCILWTGDLLTGPLLLYRMIGDPPLQIIRVMIRSGGMIEVWQYLLGLLGALVAPYHAWALILLLAAIVPLYVAFKGSTEVQASTLQVLEGIADTVDLRDPYTGGHSRRVATFSAQIVQELGMQGPEVDLIVAAARVHDIGKIGLPDQVLRKEGALSPEEWSLMTTHPVAGAQLLSQYQDFARGVAMVRHHHERWDGTGYPHGLAGKEIPFGARIIAVADGFDAMTSNRPYRAVLSVEAAIRILQDGRGQQWDGEIVDVFLRTLTSSREGRPLLPHGPDALRGSPAVSRAQD